MQPADMLWLAEKTDFDDNEATYILDYLLDAAYSIMDVGFEIAFSMNNQEFHILSKSAVLLLFSFLSRTGGLATLYLGCRASSEI